MRKLPLKLRAADVTFRTIAAICAVIPLVFLVAILIVVLIQAVPSIRFMGWHFLTGTHWSVGNLYGGMQHIQGVTVPVGAIYGALPFIVGTVLASLIACIIAVPISVCTAVILAYRVRGPLKSFLSLLIELLAGIPSVIFGLWGIIVLAPWLSHHFNPWLAHAGHVIPFLAGPVGNGMGLLTASIVLALMIIPIVTATTRDLLEQVPILMREGGTGLGMTTFEVVRIVCLPYIKDGLVGAVALGWGRALGETMAVLMVSGNALNMMPHNLYNPISTIASIIASQLDSAYTDPSKMALHAIAELALVLFALTLITNLLARFLVRRGGPTSAPKRRPSRVTE